MKVQVYEDAKTFKEDIYAILMQNEVKNELFLHNLKEAENNKQIFMAAVKSNTTIELICIWQPPFPMIFETIGNVFKEEVLHTFIIYLVKTNQVPKDFFTSDNNIEIALQLFKTHQITYKLKDELLIATMNRAQFQPKPFEHYVFKQATKADSYFLAYWYLHYAQETGGNLKTLVEADQRVQADTEKGIIFLLYDNGTPVSLVSKARERERHATINTVYTPPFYRRKGYAGACVSALCQHIFENTQKDCLLFLDKNNPITCHLYPSIGFQIIAQQDKYTIANK